MRLKRTVLNYHPLTPFVCSLRGPVLACILLTLGVGLRLGVRYFLLEADKELFDLLLYTVRLKKLY